MDADAELERPGTDEAWRRDLQQRVQEQIVHFRRGHRYWSAGYHAALYGAPISAFVTTLSALTRYSSMTSKVADGPQRPGCAGTVPRQVASESLGA